MNKLPEVVTQTTKSNLQALNHKVNSLPLHYRSLPHMQLKCSCKQNIQL